MGKTANLVRETLPKHKPRSQRELNTIQCKYIPN